jgi:uncharacterized protein YkwD
MAGEAPEGYLSGFELGVLEEINQARTNPLQYAKYLTDLRRLYHGKKLHRPGQPILITQEGLAALDEAIGYLEAARPIAELQASKGLSKSATAHVDDQTHSGALGHIGSDGSHPWDRINRHGSWKYAAAENISYGQNDARGVVIQLIVDDGTPGRGHRLNIFNPDYRYVGIACGPHRQFGMMCVMDFTGDFAETTGQ